MNQSQVFRIKATSGQTISVSTLEDADTAYTYNIHTAIFLGANSDTSAVVMDGISMTMGGSTVYNQTTINTIAITTSTHGVLLIGVKTRRTLFN
jgi:hypothetical protein